jgi:hypothetical protein
MMSSAKSNRSFGSRFFRVLLLSFMFALFTFSQSCLAGGGGAYPNGAEGFMVGAAPPPGLTLLNYTYYYNADKLTDGDGDDSKALDDVTVWADVLRMIWISKTKILGANYGQHFFFLVTDIDADLKAPMGPKLKDSYHDTDVPYLIWSPCLLTWHMMQGKLHMVLDMADIYVPLYNEEKDNPFSWGRNFWTIEPVFAVTWLPTPQWELSAKFMYDFNTRQEDYAPGPPVKVDRTPGQEFHVDFNTSYAVMPNLRAGVGGYYYRQVTNDDYHNLDNFPEPLRAVLEDLEDDQSQVWALGPGIWYQNKNFMASLRAQWEFDAKHKTEGHNVWLKLIYVF